MLPNHRRACCTAEEAGGWRGSAGMLRQGWSAGRYNFVKLSDSGGAPLAPPNPSATLQAGRDSLWRRASRWLARLHHSDPPFWAKRVEEARCCRHGRIARLASPIGSAQGSAMPPIFARFNRKAAVRWCGCGQSAFPAKAAQAMEMVGAVRLLINSAIRPGR